MTYQLIIRRGFNVLNFGVLKYYLLKLYFDVYNTNSFDTMMDINDICNRFISRQMLTFFLGYNEDI